MGMQGYLVTVTSKAEQDFLSSLIKQDTWMGGTCYPSYISSDLTLTKGPNGPATEILYNSSQGRFFWVTGPEAGQAYWEGNWSTAGTSYMYTNWSSTQHDNAHSTGEYCTHMFGSSAEWNDYLYSMSCAYIIEYGGMPGDSSLDEITSSDSSTVEIKLDPTGKTITTNIPNITVGDDIIVTDTANGKPLDDVTHTYYKKDVNGNWVELTEAPTHAGEYKVKSELTGYNGDEVTFTIRPIKLKIEDKDYTKVYDGKTDYTGSLSLSKDGMLDGRTDVEITFTQANFNDKNVESANKIHVTGITLTGDDAIDYTIDGMTNGAVDVDGSITPRPLNISSVFDVNEWCVDVPIPYTYKNNAE